MTLTAQIMLIFHWLLFNWRGIFSGDQLILKFMFRQTSMHCMPITDKNERRLGANGCRFHEIPSFRRAEKPFVVLGEKHKVLKVFIFEGKKNF